MPATNFNLAPPAKTVDGLFAVPIDIQSINGSLRFDGATQTSEGDITLDFIMGPQDGYPLFDLRQTIAEAWLDGVSISPTLIAHHNFGGGPQAELRILQSWLTAGSSHSLRLRYGLGPPQASAAGSYQPHLEWSPGPSLLFNFGFTDLGPGRYLEAWVPANLIFDQFSVTLKLQITNTTILHSVISNGTITAMGTNHWQVAWPAWSTALSTLLEIRATDTLNRLTGTVILPVSAAEVNIEVWKFSSSSVDLAAQLNNIRNFLLANESNVGRYAHNNRFVAFINTGGMEYDGGTTTGTGPLRHETFHSWWGRGIKPASHPDGWWDEGWTVYNMAGATASLPFSFTDPPVELSTCNPWSRYTPNTAYSQGERFFEGLASLIGAAQLNNFMDEFYTRYRVQPATTAQLEAHLLTRAGKAEIVDAFHRFVYGFSDPASAPDLWLRDYPAHAGADYWGGIFWDSPDLWVRRGDDGGTEHQNPEHGQDNWFYARVRNRSASIVARHFALTFNIKSFAGMQFVYPNDFLPPTAALVDFELGPGQTRIVKARWPKELVPPAGTHSCLLAALITRGDHPAAGAHVWEHNNLAQKNLSIVDLLPDEWVVIPFVIANRLHEFFPWFELVMLRPRGFEHVQAEILHAEEKLFTGWPLTATRLRHAITRSVKPVQASVTMDCGGQHEYPSFNVEPWTSRNPEAALAARLQEVSMQAFVTGRAARLRINLPRGDSLLMGWRVRVPKDTRPGSRIRVHLMQRHRLRRKPQGGIALEIHVKDGKK